MKSNQLLFFTLFIPCVFGSMLYGLDRYMGVSPEETHIIEHCFYIGVFIWWFYAFLFEAVVKRNIERIAYLVVFPMIVGITNLFSEHTSYVETIAFMRSFVVVWVIAIGTLIIEWIRGNEHA